MQVLLGLWAAFVPRMPMLCPTRTSEKPRSAVFLINKPFLIYFIPGQRSPGGCVFMLMRSRASSVAGLLSYWKVRLVLNPVTHFTTVLTSVDTPWNNVLTLVKFNWAST
jgi:hypothetical protein